MIVGGYILQPRCISESWISHAAPVTRETWAYLLLNAQYADKKYDGFILKRGQLFRSYQQIREDLRWYKGCTIERYTVSQMKGCMKALMNNHMITLTKRPRGNVITICNYEYYQNPKSYEQTNEAASNRPMKPPATDQERLAINKEREERKKKEKYIPPNPQGGKVSKKKNLKDDLSDYLVNKIKGTSFVEYQDKLIDFFEYRMSLPASSRYKTTRGIDGFLKSVGDLIRAGLNPVECLERTMEEEWLKPKPEYFKSNMQKMHNASRSDQNKQACIDFIKGAPDYAE